jgi:hypothetical protein
MDDTLALVAARVAEHLRDANAARYRLAGGPAELLEALLFRPTMNISGLAAGFVGAAAFLLAYADLPR